MYGRPCRNKLKQGVGLKKGKLNARGANKTANIKHGVMDREGSKTMCLEEKKGGVR